MRAEVLLNLLGHFTVKITRLTGAINALLKHQNHITTICVFPSIYIIDLLLLLAAFDIFLIETECLAQLDSWLPPELQKGIELPPSLKFMVSTFLILTQW